MTRECKTIIALDNLPIADGATTPNLGAAKAGALAWSTVLSDVVCYDGTTWKRLRVSGGGGTLADVDFIPQATAPAVSLMAEQVFTHKLAGKTMLAMQAASVDRVAELYEPSAYCVRKHYWEAIDGTTTPSTYNFPATIYAGGSISTATGAITVSTAVTASSRAGLYATRSWPFALRGEIGGFFFSARLYHTGGAPARAFFGMADTVGQISATPDPTASISSYFGFAKDNADGLVLSFVARVAGGPVTKIPFSNVAGTMATSVLYRDLMLYAPPADAADMSVGYAMRAFTNSGWGAWEQGSFLVGSKPAAQFYPHFFVGNGTVAISRVFGISHVYVESEFL